jgi:peptide/nickel transport system ATP-binding protein/peptide/nickel transport system permease protein
MSVAPTPVQGVLTERLAPTEAPRFLGRLLRRPVALVCIAYLLALILVALIAPVALPSTAHEHAGDLLATKQGPSWNHLLGTDTLGRDVLDRLLVGTRVTLIGVAEALAVVLALGLPTGIAAGYLGGWVDRAVGWLADLTFSMPAIVIIIVVLSVFPGSMAAAMVTLGVLAAPALMRIVRSATLPVREELYVAAARVAGLSRSYIMGRHILPRIVGPVIVQTSLLAAAALLTQTGLAFLSLVVAAPAPSWGGMIADGVGVIVLQPWLIWPPGIALALTILALGLLGDAARDTTAETWSTVGQPALRRRRSLGAPQRSADHVATDLSDALLRVEDLSVSFRSRRGEIAVVDGVSFEMRPGEVVGLVGESGGGKTITAMSIIGLLPAGGEVTGGRVVYAGRDLANLPEAALRAVRGSEIAVVSQEPMISLSPIFRVGTQLAEAVRRHQGLSRSAARAKVIELLERVQLPDAHAVARSYPYELSGGMMQRVAIARALAGKPRLLIADEPTTALDVTVRAEILELFRQLQQERAMAILLVTHDMGVVADLCDRAVVMYAGQVVEQANVLPLFREPLHPYTEALLASNPQHTNGSRSLSTIPGSVPEPGNWPRGCHFHPRCGYGTSVCRAQAISIEHPGTARETRCIHYRRLVATR